MATTTATEDQTVATPPVAPPAEHPLQNSWAVWEHRRASSVSASAYGSNMSKLCTFNTVEGFWRFANNTPCPSQMFTTEHGVSKFGDREIEGISVFKKDIRPEWEDVKNMHGGEFSIRKNMNSAQLDQFWEDLLLGTIGELIDPANVITGVRIVDKSSKGKLTYKLEVWFECSQESDPQLVDQIKDNIYTALNAQLKFEYKSHSSTMTGHGGGGAGLERQDSAGSSQSNRHHGGGGGGGHRR